MPQVHMLATAPNTMSILFQKYENMINSNKCSDKNNQIYDKATFFSLLQESFINTVLALELLQD